MFPQLDRNVPHVGDKILSFLEPKDLAASVLVCKEWHQRAGPFLYKWYAIIQREKGNVPLQRAVVHGYDHMVAFFLRDKCTDVNETEREILHIHEGSPALFEAAARGNEKIVKMLLEREDIDVNIELRQSGLTVLYAAILYGKRRDPGHGYTSTVKQLLQRPEILVNTRNEVGGNTPLMAAIKRRQANVVEELLRHPDIDVNIQDAAGHTALHHAVFNNTFGYREDFWESSLKEKIINVLIERGADIDVKLKIQDDERQTLMYYRNYISESAPRVRRKSSKC